MSAPAYPPPAYPPTDWPPLITRAQRPRWVLWRDALITFFMWGVLALILWSELAVVAEAIQVLRGKSDAQIDLELQLFWRRMQPLIGVIAVLVLLLFLSLLVSRRRRREALLAPQPAPLPRAAVARVARMSADELLAAKAPQVVTVFEEADGRYRVEAGRLSGQAPPSAR
jgi:hypothetical protein